MMSRSPRGFGRGFLLPLVLAALVAAFTWAADGWLRPMHEAGRHQRGLSPAIGLASMLEIPGAVVALRFYGATGGHGRPRMLMVMVGVNFMLYFLFARIALGLLSGGGAHGGWRRRVDSPNPAGPPTGAQTPVPIAPSIGSAPTAKIAPANGGSLPETADDATPASATLSSPVNHDTHAAPTASRRRFFAVTARSAAAFGALGAGGMLGYSLLVEPMRPRVARREFTLRGLPREMDGTRIAQLSDIHHGCWVPLDLVSRVVAQTNALKPDIVLLTGDYVHKSPAYIDPVARALGALRPRIGTLAVLGNHDWWEGAPRVRRALDAAGVQLVDNSRMILTPSGNLERRADRGVCIAGVGDLWEDETHFAAALDGIPDAMPRLLMSHNPDAAEEDTLSRGGWRVDLMLSGHTHGGQVWVPGFGHPVVPSRYGQKYAGGLVQGPSCPVLVSCGIGLAVLPVRFATPPEIIELTLRAG